MGVRGELFSARVKSKNDRRTYFFNVKENRNSDVFVTVVESKKTGEGEAFDRHQVVVFEEDLRLFRKGLDTVLEYLESREGSRSSPGGRSRGKPKGDRKPFRLRRRDSQENSGSPRTGSDGAGPDGSDSTDD
ncbi:MAG: DUF3276 family protein [Alkalispirochaeta sp.]